MAKDLSQGHGSRHWLHQRLSAISTGLLMIWIIFFARQVKGLDFENLIIILKKPYNLIPFMLLTASSYYHGLLGMRVIIEDYISNIYIRNFFILITQIFAVISFILVISAIFYLGK